MLAGKGVTAWQRALASLVPSARTTPAGSPAPGGRPALLPAGLTAELISALAAVALAAAGGVPP